MMVGLPEIGWMPQQNQHSSRLGTWNPVSCWTDVDEGESMKCRVFVSSVGDRVRRFSFGRPAGKNTDSKARDRT